MAGEYGTAFGKGNSGKNTIMFTGFIQMRSVDRNTEGRIMKVTARRKTPEVQSD